MHRGQLVGTSGKTASTHPGEGLQTMRSRYLWFRPPHEAWAALVCPATWCSCGLLCQSGSSREMDHVAAAHVASVHTASPTWHPHMQPWSMWPWSKWRPCTWPRLTEHPLTWHPLSWGGTRSSFSGSRCRDHVLCPWIARPGDRVPPPDLQEWGLRSSSPGAQTWGWAGPGAPQSPSPCSAIFLGPGASPL